MAGFRAGRVGRKQPLMTHELMQNELLRYLDAMMVSREQRLAAVTASIPRVLWYVVIIGAFLMIAFCGCCPWSSCRGSFWAGSPRSSLGS